MAGADGRIAAPHRRDRHAKRRVERADGARALTRGDDSAITHMDLDRGLARRVLREGARVFPIVHDDAETLQPEMGLI